MLDRNGMEIRTGQIVEITGSYRKREDGCYVVTASPGDPGWGGMRHMLARSSESGRINRVQGGNHGWPIIVSNYDMPDPRRAAEAHAWNEAHARIEVKGTVDASEIAAYMAEVTGGRRYRLIGATG